MKEYIASVMNVVDEMRAIGGQEICSDDEMVKCYLLKNLPEEYDSLVTALEIRDREVVTVDFVKSKLIDEWNKRRHHPDVETAMKVTHESRSMKCFFCHKTGHVKRDCMRYKRWLEQKDKPGSSGGAKKDDSHKVNAVTHHNDDSWVFLFQETADLDNWYIDSGATRHICCNRKFFNEIDTKLVEYVNLMENQYGRRPKVLRSDRGGEYEAHYIQKYLKEKGIQFQCSCAITPQQNGTA